MVTFYKKWKKVQENSKNKKQNLLKQSKNEKSSTLRSSEEMLIKKTLKQFTETFV